MEIINNPHDKYFKQVMGDKETTRDFLKNYLPRDLLEIIDLESLVIQKDGFIEKELQEHFSDIVYRVKINGRDGYLYLLFEHKSYLYKTTALQLIKYIVSFWDQKVNKEKSITLPPVIPLVLYHGKERWQIKHDLASIIEGIEDLPEPLKRFIPNYEYLFYDFSSYSAEEIRGGVELRIFISILNAVFKEEKEFLATVTRSMQALEELDRGQKATDYLETMVRYIINARDDMCYVDMHDAVKNVSPKGGELLMTIAEKLINEGMEKGKEEGREEGREEVALQMLLENEPVERIARYTGLSKKRIEELRRQGS